MSILDPAIYARVVSEAQSLEAGLFESIPYSDRAINMLAVRKAFAKKVGANGGG